MDAKISVRDYLQHNVLLFDGAMGTYLGQISHDIAENGEPCELANLHQPDMVLQVHKAYVQAGAMALKTNTFGLNQQLPGLSADQIGQIISRGWQLACQAAEFALPGRPAPFIFADFGPLSALEPDKVAWSKGLVDSFLELGAENFLFETFSDEQGLAELAAYVKQQCPQAFIIASFAVQPDGYTRTGRFGADLLAAVRQIAQIDAVGFNCVSGPYHLRRYLQSQQLLPAANEDKLLSIMPNAGYPTVINNRSFFSNSPEYYAGQLGQIAQQGVRILGGCCGTTPEHIAAVAQVLAQQSKNEDDAQKVTGQSVSMVSQPLVNHFRQKAEANKRRLLAVELEPPQDVNLPLFMQKAQILQQAGVDIITVPDCPIGRARMDSSLLACKLHRELGVDVLPHMTCRDRNLNAIKALLLGLSVEGVNNVLIVTGDPIPTAERDEIKSVFNFNSRMLARFISNLNESTLLTPFYICGALNLNVRNFDVQLRLAQEKIAGGVQMFLTQPVLSEQAALNLRRAYQELDAKILAGIMPVVSYRNACFMNNEVAGISVDEAIVQQYKDKTPEQARALAVELSCRIMRGVADFSNGYYMIPPFNRVDIICDILQQCGCLN